MTDNVHLTEATVLVTPEVLREVNKYRDEGVL